jgi:hypothetical protein
MVDFTFFLPLPFKAKVLVKEGENVNKRQKVAAFRRRKKYYLDLAKNLRVPPKKVNRYLLVGLGQKIKQDEPVATAKSLIKKVTINSPVSGQVLAFDNNTGKLTIEIDGKDQDLLAPFSGNIKTVGQEGVTFKLAVEKVFEIKNYQGKEVFGQLAYHCSSLIAFSCQYQNRVVLVDRLSPALANKAWAINSLAIISHNEISSTKTDINLAQISPEQAEELKNFIGQPVIIDPQQKKLAVLKNEA